MTSCSPLEDPGRSWDAEAKMVKKTAQNGEVMGYHVNIYEYHSNIFEYNSDNLVIC